MHPDNRIDFHDHDDGLTYDHYGTASFHQHDGHPPHQHFDRTNAHINHDRYRVVYHFTVRPWDGAEHPALHSDHPGYDITLRTPRTTRPAP